MKQVLTAAGAVGLIMSQPAQAAPDLKAMHGVWSGTIGDLPVRACYESAEYTASGRYFYVRRLSTIPLQSEEMVAGGLTEVWPDTKDAARWRMTSITKDSAVGVWTGKGRTLPIRLTRLPFSTGEDVDGPCGSTAFYEPIFAATRIVKHPRRVQGLAIEQWTLAFPDESVSIGTFQLKGSSTAIAAINRRLREPFDRPEEAWKWCLQNAGASGGYYQNDIEARLVTARWLSVMSSSGDYCGGAHPNNSNQPTLFDRQSGKQVDLYSWLASAFSHQEKVEGYSETIDTLTGRLFDLVLKLHPRTTDKSDDCGDVVVQASSWTLELKAEGIAFTPDLPRVVMACGDEVILSWAKLAPFLSPTGKREVAALRAELRS